MSDVEFYTKIPSSENLNQIQTVELPKDWFVIITDIVNSTEAIENNKYKDVNALSALAIVGITNIRKDLELPFVFGGDGVTVCVPPEILEQVKSTLYYTVQMAESEFALKLRVGILPYADLKENPIHVGKLKISPRYSQTIFLGSGVEQAEFLTKKDKDSSYLIQKIEQPEADYSGFSCRWKAIPSIHGEMVSIIIKAIDTDLNSQDKIYDQIIESIDKIFGGIDSYHPVREEKLQLSMSSDKLSTLSKIETKNPIKKFLLIYKYRLEHILLSSLILFAKNLVLIKGRPEKQVKAKDVKTTIRNSADFRKYDGTLKMVISGTKEQRSNLENYLESLYKQKKIAYGLHVSKDALMTCLLFEGTENEVHFIDGADGGYALAAKEFKKRLLELQTV
jgi:hypothetical protein